MCCFGAKARLAMTCSDDLFMTNAEIQAIIAQAAQAWMTGNAEAFAALFVSDGLLIVPGKTYRGRNAIRAVTADFSARHTHVNINLSRMINEGDAAVVEWHWQDIEIETGIHHAADDAIVVDFYDGQIIRWREYIDTKTPASAEP